MQDLFRRNPVGAIPVILKRLKQKDLEWRKARQQLSNQWRDVLVKNAARSLDHRSFYFRLNSTHFRPDFFQRQQDKRSFTSRYLLADIKGSVYNQLPN
jgi:paired amphipathic helix protein Sin3a